MVVPNHLQVTHVGKFSSKGSFAIEGVDFAYKDRKTGIAFIGVDDWQVNVDSRGIQVERRGKGNSSGGPIVHRVEFGQVIPGTIIFNAVNSNALHQLAGDDDVSGYVDDRVQINKLKYKVKELEEELNLMMNDRHRDGEELGKLREEVIKLRETVAHVARRSLLNKARDQILRCYYYAIDHLGKTKLPKGHLDKHDPKLSVDVKNRFFKSLGRGNRDTLVKHIQAVVTKHWPRLGLDAIKMACHGEAGDKVRRAGNKAAHEVDLADVLMSMSANPDGLDS
ncbi:hypothetical protein BDN72DRAFT_881202 [Pluteus cervinus]|uniref:Uncharacterized protein n=1 Tax=Pluteus cervinus TaxID=181527 RepID=A0ACD3AHD4_9AGAR|nr:hypothetical protein BDN72DRAFT_881202 [Pluteus cervinus]